MTTFCPQCGTQAQDGQRFCAVCGARLLVPENGAHEASVSSAGVPGAGGDPADAVSVDLGGRQPIERHEPTAAEIALQKTQNDLAAAGRVSDEISSLTGASPEALVKSARGSYDALSDDQKKFVDDSHLVELEDRIAERHELEELRRQRAEELAQKKREEAERKKAEDDARAREQREASDREWRQKQAAYSSVVDDSDDDDDVGAGSGRDGKRGRKKGKRRHERVQVPDSDGARPVHEGGKDSGRPLSRAERRQRQKDLEKAKKETRKQIKQKTKSLKSRAASADDELVQQFKDARARRSKAKNVYDAIGFDFMFEDGTCQVEQGLFSQTIAFTDISYQSARIEDQKTYFDLYCQVFDYCGADTSLQLNVINQPLPRDQVGHRKFFDDSDPVTGSLAAEYNKVLNDKMKEGISNIERERYLTFSVGADTYDDALPKLARMRSDLSRALSKLGCQVKKLDGVGRLKLMQQLLRPESEFTFSYDQLLSSGLTAKDFVVPSSIDFYPDHDNRRFDMSGKYCQVLSIRSFGSRLSDSALSDIIDLDIPMDVSLHTQAIDKGKSSDFVLRQLGWIDKDIIDQQQHAARQGFDGALIPQELAYSKNEAEELLEELQYKNQRLFLFSGCIYVWADTQEELDGRCVQVVRAARRNSIEVDELPAQQRQGLNASLPLAHNYLLQSRYLTTAQVGMMLPFATQELNQPGGCYYGQNKVSKNLIMLDRATLPSGGHGWVLGMSGSGKSFFIKREIMSNYLLHPDDEFIIIDPQQEYPPLVEGLGGQVVRLSPGSKDHINVFDIYESATDTGENPISFKGETIIALANAMVGGSGLTSEEKTIVDRCTRLTYERCSKTGETPTLGVFYAILQEQPELAARNLKTSFEMYVTGSLSYFTSETTVNLNKRITAFSFKQLGAQMKLFAMLIILDWVYSRMLYNFDRGVKTWLYIDEVQTLFNDDAVIDWFDTFYSTGRKYNMVVTCMTQTVERILTHDRARFLLANADFLALLKQSDTDRRELTAILNLSEQQSSYMARDISPGEGLLIAGNATIPFEDDFPKGRLYDLWNTKPDEIAEKKKAEAGSSSVHTEFGSVESTVGGEANEGQEDVPAQSAAAGRQKSY